MQYGDNGGAVGYLLGEEHQGMRCMFTMMNNARLGVGVEGVGIAERAYQQALGYAHERTQGRAIGAAPGTESPIIDHPDVQRMLLDMKSTIAAMRGLTYRNAEALDHAHHGADEDARTKGDERAALLTPLSKSWCTDMGVELASIGVQIHGGMGFVEETGAAQHFRDARIAPIYEGTNGIQAIDLAGRKLGCGRAASSVTTSPRSVPPSPPSRVSRGSRRCGSSCRSRSMRPCGDRVSPRGVGLEPVRHARRCDGVPEHDGHHHGRPDPGRRGTFRSFAGAEEAEDRAVMARFFAANRLAGVPGLLPAVTAGAGDLSAARGRLLST